MKQIQFRREEYENEGLSGWGIIVVAVVVLLLLLVGAVVMFLPHSFLHVP